MVFQIPLGLFLLFSKVILKNSDLALLNRKTALFRALLFLSQSAGVFDILQFLEACPAPFVSLKLYKPYLPLLLHFCPNDIHTMGCSSFFGTNSSEIFYLPSSQYLEYKETLDTYSHNFFLTSLLVLVSMRTCATAAKDENSNRAHCAADGKCLLNDEGKCDSTRRHLIAGER